MKNQDRNLERIGQTILPSWLELTVAAIITVIMGAGAYLSKVINSNTDFQGGVSLLGSSTSSSIQRVTDSLAQNTLISNLPLLFFWASVGFVVYSSAIHVSAIFSNAEDLREQMGYVHSSRQALVNDAIMRLVIRTVAVVAWAFYIKLFIVIIIPYTLAAFQVSFNAILLSDKILYSLLAAAVMIFGLHIHVMLLRIITLRSKLLS
ncbi:MAG: hypothetical protein JWM81_481 [Candidatus Saccharibacteria bacterium]|nr:hypothetical protein [Candidatus Saccharibacteria bacterium]